MTRVQFWYLTHIFPKTVNHLVPYSEVSIIQPLPSVYACKNHLVIVWTIRLSPDENIHNAAWGPRKPLMRTDTKKSSGGLLFRRIQTLKWKKAVTYSPALHCSTIGASGLNFSVRNGKRWNPAAVATWYGGHANVTDFLFCRIDSCNTTESVCQGRKALGQLVALGFDVAVFTPAPYQRRRLRRPSVEF